MEPPVGPDGQPVVPAEVWVACSPAVQAVLVGLTRQVVALGVEVRTLRAQLARDSTNSSRPPSSDGPGTRARRAKRRPPTPPSGRRRGAQPGHAAHRRSLLPAARVDAVVVHRPVACRVCHAPLAGGADVGAPVCHQVTELPVVRAHVTEHQRHRVRCAACGATTRAPLPPGVPPTPFGPRLQATVALLSGRYRLSRREVADLCSTVLDAPVCVGSVDRLCRQTSAALAAPVEALTAAVQRAPVVQVDETSWPQAGVLRWLWVARTATALVFRIARTRGSVVARALLGEDFATRATGAGILVSDRYSAYGWVDVAARQLCWAHLARDFQALVDRGGPAAALGTRALAQVRALFALWHRFHAGACDRATLQEEAVPVQDALSALVQEGATRPDLTAQDPQAAGFCRALDRLWPALWTFLDTDGVPPTNNAAERALRPAVLWRTGSHGTQSDAGSAFVARLLSVAATCTQQGRALLAYLTDACTAALHGRDAPLLLPATA